MKIGTSKRPKATYENFPGPGNYIDPLNEK